MRAATCPIDDLEMRSSQPQHPVRLTEAIFQKGQQQKPWVSLRRKATWRGSATEVCSLPNAGRLRRQKAPMLGGDAAMNPSGSPAFSAGLVGVKLKFQFAGEFIPGFL